MLRTIYLPKNQNFKKMVRLKVHGNINFLRRFVLFFERELAFLFRSFLFNTQLILLTIYSIFHDVQVKVLLQDVLSNKCSSESLAPCCGISLASK